jgi:transcription antitermination factor NusG
MKFSALNAQWIALQVRARMERTTAQHLEYRGYEWFLPKRRFTDEATGKEAESPLFPGYVFCRFDDMAGAPIVTIPGVTRIVGFGGAPACIEEEEIGAIKLAVDSGQTMLPLPMYQPGNVVVVEDGPLRGVSGTVLGIDDKEYLIVSITLLQRSIAVELDPRWVRLTTGPDDSARWTAH